MSSFRLVAAEHRRKFARERLGTGIAALDKLLGGGVETGSSTLLLGPALPPRQDRLGD